MHLKQPYWKQQKLLNMLNWLQDIGIIGFWFFFIKGMLWLVVFALLYAGIINKATFEKIKSKMRFYKKSKA
jgi:hypothetical protein